MNTAPRSIQTLNRLPPEERRRWFGRMIPPSLLAGYQIDPDTFAGPGGQPLLSITASGASAEIDLRHAPGAPDALYYAQVTDTLNGQIGVMMAVVNDPAAPRFDVDRMPDGSRTAFGAFRRNVPAEMAALQAGLAPGQVRRGLRRLSDLITAFEGFVSALGQSMYFAEPLSYHNAVVFERYGFAYQQGRRWMESLNTRFSPGGDLLPRLDGSTPFRQPDFAHSIRGRSWAIHDGVLLEPYTGVHMYKHVGKHAGVETFPGGAW